MRQVSARPDPEQPARQVTLPVSWDDDAASALAALVPGDGPVSLAGAAAVWLGLVAARAGQGPGPGQGQGQIGDIAARLKSLLQQRRAAPNAAVWRCEPGIPGFVLNAAGFHDAASGYDVHGFAEAAGLAAKACRLLAPQAPRYEIGLAGLDDLLACLGVAYDSKAARDLGACLAALLRARVEAALEGDQGDLLARPAAWPAPPRHCVIPGLAEAAASARALVARAPDAVPATGVFAPGPAEALLGVETGGVAPAFSPVRAQHLTRAAQDRLAAASMSAEAALASALLGETPLPVADAHAYAAMLSALAPYLDVVPPLPASLPAPGALSVPTQDAAPPRHARLPARHRGLSQKILLGGHRVFLRTGEYPDGRLGEITLTLPRESQAVRGLAEGFAASMSLGLQHGVPLEAFVDAFAATRFGFAGVVEGDPDVDRASSILDYVMRTLAANYLGRALPAPELDEDAEGEAAATAPLLPLDLPRGAVAKARRRALRLVA
jgi:hypothetical protein